jgi:hypothetical protein
VVSRLAVDIGKGTSISKDQRSKHSLNRKGLIMNCAKQFMIFDNKKRAQG